MPCTLQPWEIECINRETLKGGLTFKRKKQKLNDWDLLEEVACSACRALVECGGISKAPKIVRKWWKQHSEKDLAAGREVPTSKKARKGKKR